MTDNITVKHRDKNHIQDEHAGQHSKVKRGYKRHNLKQMPK